MSSSHASEEGASDVGGAACVSGCPGCNGEDEAALCKLGGTLASVAEKGELALGVPRARRPATGTAFAAEGKSDVLLVLLPGIGESAPSPAGAVPSCPLAVERDANGDAMELAVPPRPRPRLLLLPPPVGDDVVCRSPAATERKLLKSAAKGSSKFMLCPARRTPASRFFSPFPFL